MDIILFAAITVVVGFISIYGRSSNLRASAFAALIVSTIAIWYCSLGLPRPQYLHVPTGTVLSYSLDEPKAIYLWLVPDGSAQPLAFQLPWRSDVAGNLVDAARSRATPNDTLRVKNQQFGRGLPVKPVFYVSRARGEPPKTDVRLVRSRS